MTAAVLDRVSTTEANKHLVRRLMFDDISQANEAVAAEVIHPDFVDHTNPPGMQHGLAGHTAVIRLFHAAFPDSEWLIDDEAAEGDRVVIRTTFRGTHRGDFFGIPATGKRVEITGIHMLRIADGRVIEHWGQNDDLLMMRQLGALPT